MMRTVACLSRSSFRIFSSAHTFFHCVYGSRLRSSLSLILAPTPASSFGRAAIGVWTFLLIFNLHRRTPTESILYETALVISNARKLKEGGRPSGSRKRNGKRRTSVPGWG